MEMIVTVFAGFTWILIQTVRNDFKLYLSQAYLNIAIEKDNKISLINLFVKGIDTYNDYLRRSLKFEIKDLKKIYSKIISDSTLKV
jgi:hypothetical protein